MSVIRLTTLKDLQLWQLNSAKDVHVMYQKLVVALKKSDINEPNGGN